LNWECFLSNNGVLLTAAVISRFKKIGGFVRKPRKHELENKSDHRLIAKSAKFCGNVELLQQQQILQLMEDCGPY